MDGDISIAMSFAPKFAFWFISWGIIAAVGIFTSNSIPRPYSYPFILLGILLMGYGLTLNALAGRTLKIYGHFDIKKGIKKPDRLVTVGIYSCMRHPAQFGSIFFGVGIALITANLYSILLAGWFFAFALYFILAVEERETLADFGEEYAEFLRTRKPFSFSIKCLREGFRALKN